MGSPGWLGSVPGRAAVRETLPPSLAFKYLFQQYISSILLLLCEILSHSKDSSRNSPESGSVLSLGHISRGQKTVIEMKLKGNV